MTRGVVSIAFSAPRRPSPATATASHMPTSKWVVVQPSPPQQYDDGGRGERRHQQLQHPDQPVRAGRPEQQQAEEQQHAPTGHDRERRPGAAVEELLDARLRRLHAALHEREPPLLAPEPRERQAHRCGDPGEDQRATGHPVGPPQDHQPAVGAEPRPQRLRFVVVLVLRELGGEAEQHRPVGALLGKGWGLGRGTASEPEVLPLAHGHRVLRPHGSLGRAPR